MTAVTQLDAFRAPDKKWDRFQELLKANPWIEVWLVDQVRKLQKRGHDRVGAKMLWEALRLHAMTEGTPLHLNNSFTPYVSRYLAERYPDMADLFEFRELKSA